MSEFNNVVEYFLSTAKRRSKADCLKFIKNKKWKTLDWDETLKEVQKLSEGLSQLGVKKGDKVAILSNTRVEWTLADVAILSLGAVSVPIYQSVLSSEVLHILQNSETVALFIEDKKQLKKFEEIADKAKTVKKLILIEGKSTNKNVITFKELLTKGENFNEDSFAERVADIKAGDLATLVYTSGTTGEPKGVILEHSCLLSEIDAAQDMFEFREDDKSLLFLPLAHILARAVQWFQLTQGYTHAYAESIDRLVDNIKVIRPTFLVSVPRIFEKIYSKVLNDVEHGSFIKKAIFKWALELGKKVSQLNLEHKSIPLTMSLQYSVAHALVFSKLSERLGGRIRFFVSGGAPLSKEIAEFFHAAGMIILEGYGLTETSGAITVNSLDHAKFGSVGVPIKGAEIKIAEDGEILAKGDMVFKGYYKMPEATDECLKEGWFATGDIGEFDEQGFLKITDRKKDLIVTAGGKNVAPQYIENLIKNEGLISQIMVHGDKRKYLSALVTLDQDQLRALALAQGIDKNTYDELTQDPKIFKLVKNLIDSSNKKLPSYETIKKFAILSEDFTVENGALTPSLKVKRKFVTQKYQKILDGFYND